MPYGGVDRDALAVRSGLAKLGDDAWVYRLFHFREALPGIRFQAGESAGDRFEIEHRRVELRCQFAPAQRRGDGRSRAARVE